jgi:hypothetical protein
MSRWLIVLVWAGPMIHAQTFSQRGFVDMSGMFYPQLVVNDKAHAVAGALVRYEPRWQPRPWLVLDASFDARIDTHHEVSRSGGLDWQDRSLQRPDLSIRYLSAVLTRKSFSVRIGKQFIRWGEADFLNPTDRFAPKDLLIPIEQGVLAVTAVRLTYATKNDSFDFVWQPRFTPGRIPLLNQRWTFLPATLAEVHIDDQGPVFPGRSIFGVRWSHAANRYEYSLSYYDGFNYLPAFSVRMDPSISRVTFLRTYPALRLYGADLAIPLSLFTVKAEASYYRSPDNRQDEYLIYVLQCGRQVRELGFMFGYVGQVVTSHRSVLQFPGERGFTRALIAHGQYALDTNRAITADVFVRQNGKGTVIRPGFSQAFGDHWRANISLAWLHGEESDFLGQYHRNSFAMAELRYSF